MDHNSKRRYLRDGRAPVPRRELTSRIMSRIRGKDTKPEILLRKGLWVAGLKGYRLHWKNIPGRPDICYPKRRFAVFVNGCYWHRCPYCKLSLPKTHKKFWKEKFAKNQERDRMKTEQLRKNGWTVSTVWECQVERDVGRIVENIGNKIKHLK